MRCAAAVAAFLAAGVSNLAAETVLEMRVDTTVFALTPDDIASVAVVETGEPALTFRLNAAGARALANITTQNIGRSLELSICGEVLIRPVIQEAIHGGSFMVSSVPNDAIQAYLSVLRGEAPCESLAD